MKKKFTFLIAAMMLLTMINLPAVAFGQKGSPDVLNIDAYASANSWSDATQYTSATVGNVTFTAGSNNGSNTGKYYTTDDTWRFYANESATITIEVAEGYTLSSVTFTFTIKDKGTLKKGTSTVTSGTAFSVSGSSAVFTIGSSEGSKGKVFFTEISVSYASSGYSVTYKAGAGTGSDKVVSGIASGTAHYVLANEGTGNPGFTKTGYTFSHWNTVANGSGTSYYHDDNEEHNHFSVTSNTDLFAMWSANTYDLQTASMSNGSVSFTVGGAPAITAKTDQTVTLVITPDSGYGLDELTVTNDDTSETVEVTGNNTFTMPASDITVSATFKEAYNITFSVNGAIKAGLTKVIDKGDAVGVLPTPAAVDIPDGFTFKGWISAIHYYNASDAPTYIETTEKPSGNVTYYAVFCVSTPGPNNWTLTSDAPAGGDEVILAAKNGDNYYAMFADDDNLTISSSFTLTDNIINSVPSGFVWYIESAGGSNVYLFSGLYKDNESQTSNKKYLHLNKSSYKIATGTTNGKFTFNSSGSGYTATAGDSNTRYITFNSSTPAFNGTSTSEDACTLYVFRYIAGAPTLSDYTTLVTNHGNDTFIAEAAEETLYGIHYINGYVLAGNDVTNNGKIIIKNSGNLDMDGSSLSNSTAANLIIEDGGQLVTNNAVQATLKKEIVGFGGDNTVQTGWYTIASPLTTDFTPTSDMLTATYDLYYYDEEGMKWKNYRQVPFEIAPEKGYLYANTADKTISFAGDVLASDATVTEALSFAAVDDNVKGFNLMGNPFTCNITNSSNVKIGGDAFSAYYIADGTITAGQNLIACNLADREIKPCEGFIVQATAVSQNLEFNPVADPGKRGETKVKSSFIRIEAGNEDFMDRAYVQLGEGNTLRKMTINDNVAQVYVMNDGKDYAAATIAEAQGEMPVNFKASQDGQYTINVALENVEVDYLHLIDNIAGTDIDLLANPSYSFNAKSDDYESRFRLVFSANMANAEMGEDFAFISNGQLVIANVGEAILQVIDVTGRVVAIENINGTCSKAINAKAGVYVLRLINGTDVKTQKMVIR